VDKKTAITQKATVLDATVYKQTSDVWVQSNPIVRKLANEDEAEFQTMFQMIKQRLIIDNKRVNCLHFLCLTAVKPAPATHEPPGLYCLRSRLDGHLGQARVSRP